jgi:integrase
MQVSTKERNRNRALKIAIELEEAARQRDSQEQLRQRFDQISEQLFGAPLPADTVADYFAKVQMQRVGEISASTAKRYAQVAKDFIEHIGPAAQRPLREIKRATIVEFRAKVAERTSAGNANASMKSLSSFFTRAQQDGVIRDNPAAHLKPLAEEAKAEGERRRPFTNEELIALYAAAETAGKEWPGIVTIGCLTAQRLGDVATMRWSALSPVNEKVCVWTFKSRKTKRAMNLPLEIKLLESIGSKVGSGKVGDSAFLFPDAAAAYLHSARANTLSNRFHDILVNAKLLPTRTHKAEKSGRRAARKTSEISFHSLRHLVTSRLYALGVPRSVAMDLVGHETVESSNTYTHVDFGEKFAAQQKLLSSLPIRLG